MQETIPCLPPALQAYVQQSGFWAGAADYDFWYAVSTEGYFWLHLRRRAERVLAVAIFFDTEGPVDLDLYDLSRAGIHGLRATIANTPLMTLRRYEPPLPIVALRLPQGETQVFTLARRAESLSDQWLQDTLHRILAALCPTWQISHAGWEVEPQAARHLWPEWAGPLPL